MGGERCSVLPRHLRRCASGRGSFSCTCCCLSNQTGAGQPEGFVGSVDHHMMMPACEPWPWPGCLGRYCFNATTLRPDRVELYHVESDKLETTDMAVVQPQIVQRLLHRLTEFVTSSDQVPPTLKPTLYDEANHTTQLGSSSWNYQCPQCPARGASVSTSAGGRRAWVPWCDGVRCVPQNCTSLFAGNACSQT